MDVMQIHWYECSCIILYHSSKSGLPDEFVKNDFVNLITRCHLFPPVKRDLCFRSGEDDSITEKSTIVGNSIYCDKVECNRNRSVKDKSFNLFKWVHLILKMVTIANFVLICSKQS